MHITRFQFPRSSTCSQLAAACRCAKCCQRRAPKGINFHRQRLCRELVNGSSTRPSSASSFVSQQRHLVLVRSAQQSCSSRCASVHLWSFDACQRQCCALSPLHSSRESLSAPHACVIRRRLSFMSSSVTCAVHLPHIVITLLTQFVCTARVLRRCLRSVR